MAFSVQTKPTRPFFFIAIIGFFGIASTTLSKNPVLPLYVTALGGNEALLGLIAAVSPLAGILFSFPVGALSDQWGRRKMLLVAALVFLLAPVLYLVVSSPAWLIPIRFFHGMATAILGPVAAAAIVSFYPAEKGARLGSYSSVTLIGRTLAPLLGGIIITTFVTWRPLLNYQLVYVAAFVLAWPILAAVLFLPDAPAVPDKTKHLTPGDVVRSLGVFLRSPMLVAIASADMATYFAFGVLETYLPLYLASQQIRADQMGLIFTLQILAIAATKPIFGKVADRFDNRWQILLGLTVLFAAMLLLPGVSGFWPWALVAILFGLGMSLSTVATAAYTAEISRREQLGASLGALSSIMDIGHSSGPLLTGLIVAAATFTLGFQVTAAVCAAVAIGFAMVVFRRPSTSA